MSSKTLYLVDISSYIFRAYYAIRALKTSKGIPTNATYGVVTMLLKLVREKKPDHLILAFDSPSPTHRKEIYPQYKANREVPPEDLPVQFDHIKAFVEAWPLPRAEVPGYEADDIIATLVKKYRKEGMVIVIVSADKDLMQLVGSGVTMYDSMKEKLITTKEVEERFGVGPEKVVAGDASDNVPGVGGVGEKTAIKLIQEYGSLEEVLEHATEIKGKLGENLANGKSDALMSKRLVTLHSDVPLKLDWDYFELPQPGQDRLNEFYREMEFTRLVSESAQEEKKHVEEKKEAKGEYELILSEKDLSRWINRLRKTKEGFCFDTETTSVDPLRARLVGLSLSDTSGSACYIPLAHSYLGCPDQLPKKSVLDRLKPLFADPKIPKFGQNAKYDMEVLSGEGIEVRGLKGDTLIASYLLNPESAHNLDHLAREYLDTETLKFSEVVGRGKTFDSVDVETACRYAAEDADVTFQLVSKLHPLLKKEELRDCYEKIEIPLVDVLFRMETHGVLVDTSLLAQLDREFSDKMDRLQKEVFENAGVEFNLNSPKQVAEVLFGKLLLPRQRKTKTGYSTDVEVLTDLAPLHPVPRLLADYRILSKLKSTYVDQLRNLIHPKTGRIHTSYNQTVTATGRLSSSDPNLQNIPIRTEEGKRIRQAFIAPSGWKILSADYSQIELRLLAAFSGDKNLQEAFAENKDIHRMTAAKIFGMKEGEVTSEQRSTAKTVNFGIIYGQSPFGLSNQLGIPAGTAKKYIDEFYRLYPAVSEYREKVFNDAKKTGMVRTWQGRKRLVPEINSKNLNLRSNAERAAFNTIFQGSAADLIKVAMIQIDRKLSSQSRARMIMQVHDELIFEVPENEVETVSCFVKKEMEEALPCEVALKVDIGVGNNWAEAH
ncbi:MAG: DNA polymerase I [Deltaproteobacteria bacterium]|nr:DNA polymerase I [Deltaproteobacteria bacterium]